MKRIGFIGFGNMASAIALGIINAKFLNANEIIAYDIDENKAEKMRSYHIDVAHDIDELIACSEFIFVGVKPQVVESVLDPYIQKLEKAKDEVEDTADKSQQIVEEHLRK